MLRISCNFDSKDYAYVHKLGIWLHEINDGINILSECLNSMESLVEMGKIALFKCNMHIDMLFLLLLEILL